jgi:hydroxymethylpyrimidine pyrophosphatase-like HAD family hydrolase
MKHHIKMIVTDLDETLLRTDKTISTYTRDVISKCRDIGIKVAYATLFVQCVDIGRK